MTDYFDHYISLNKDHPAIFAHFSYISIRPTRVLWFARVCTWSYYAVSNCLCRCMTILSVSVCAYVLSIPSMSIFVENVDYYYNSIVVPAAVK